jgi:hypothetical protein
MGASYAADHADALATLRADGAPIVFTKVSRSVVSATNVASLPTSVSVRCYAVQDSPSIKRYNDLGLKPERSITLFAAPETFGEEPQIGSDCAWGGRDYVVKWFDAVAPAGETIGYTVVCSR